jgi:hypothetical protein
VIGIALDKDVVEAGEFLTGTVHWLADGDRLARQLIVAAEWRTDGQGNRAYGIGRAAVFPLPPGVRERSVRLRLLIPYEGPVTFTGELMSVNWTLRVRVDQSGLDQTIESAFRVIPRQG